MRHVLFVPLLIYALRASAHPAVSYYPSVRNLEKRQEALPATSSSYDFWWPYPAWGATTAANTLTSPTYATNPLATTPMTAAPAVSSVSTTNQVVNLPSSDPPPSSTTPFTSNSPSSTTPQPLVSSSSTSSSVNSAPKITITALPPAVNPSRHYKQTGFSSFKPGYLAGIFAVAGAIVGFAFTWLLITIIRKCSSRRDGSIIAGAPYSAPQEAQQMNRTLTDIHESISRFLGVPPPESRPILDGGDGMARRTSWLQRAFTSHRREGARSRADSAVQGVAGGVAMEEGAPFLAPPSRSHTPARMSSSRSGRTMTRERSMAERNVQSPQELEEDEALDNAPFDTLRHKSIRRDIIQRIAHGSYYRKGHKRVDSDLNIDDMRQSEGGESVLTAAFRDSPEIGSIMTSLTSTSIPIPASSAASSRSASGFRIVEEDPECESYESRRSSRSTRNYSRAPLSPVKGHPSTDSYTALPTRSPEKRNIARATKTNLIPVKPLRIRNPRANMARVDSSVLPASPPMVTSPPLDAQLFFNATSEFDSAPKPDLTISSESSYSESGQSLPTRKVVNGNRLRTQRLPPRLPFPSSPHFSPPKRLTKKPPHPPSLTPEETRGSSSASKASSSSSGTTPSERFARRHGALSKVEQILAESWSARELRGEECPASPNMFGAISQKHHNRGGGIEQRLSRRND
ncbi:hypothetical protein BDY19DRAFT_528696 [Irpex rosettiformis]|uniref:Uncharacterized protein n=1 Tax=Irpex rosettiformis TaxID=378272 RepID=A0ACB8TR66_9APHY|nr:hypothetical protein BDY19DRAFT_528696 [Irpex rosettiformis]